MLFDLPLGLKFTKVHSKTSIRPASQGEIFRARYRRTNHWHCARRWSKRLVVALRISEPMALPTIGVHTGTEQPGAREAATGVGRFPDISVTTAAGALEREPGCMVGKHPQVPRDLVRRPRKSGARRSQISPESLESIRENGFPAVRRVPTVFGPGKGFSSRSRGQHTCAGAA
jgi:hypothetical protein